MSNYSKLRDLAWQEKFLLVQLIFCLAWVSFSLRFFGYLRTRRWLLCFTSSTDLHQADDIELARAERTAQLIAIAGRHGLVTATCLPQSVLLEYRLKRIHLAAEIKIGVRKSDDCFDAHAWVELNGTAVAQDDLGHHQVLQ